MIDKVGFAHFQCWRQRLFGIGVFEMIILSVVGLLVIGVPILVIGIVIALNANKPKQQ